MKIRYRIYDAADQPPMLGDYLMSERGRGGYLILGVEDRGARGGLGEPVFRLVLLAVERVPRAECLANCDRLWTIKWDRRKRRANRRFAA
jgi:hypothetical protein